MPGLPLSIGTLRALQKELSVSADARKPLVVGGARALVPALRRRLGISGNDDPRRAEGARDLRPGVGGFADDASSPEGAAVYVHIWAGDGSDEAALKRARRARTPIVALAPREIDDVPYVLATDVVPLLPGEGFPLEALAGRIAARLGEEAAPLAARLPALRRAVAEQLIASFARKNALVAVFVSGAALPVLLGNQVRLLLRLEQAYGRDPDPRERAPEILVTVAAGFGLRAAARGLLDLVRIPRRAVQGGIAYAGTRALGEAAVRRLEAVEGRHG